MDEAMLIKAGKEQGDKSKGISNLNMICEINDAL